MPVQIAIHPPSREDGKKKARNGEKPANAVVRWHAGVCGRSSVASDYGQMKQMHDDWQVIGSQLNSKTPPQGAQPASQAILLARQHLDSCCPAAAGVENPATASAGRSSRTRRLR